MIPDGVPGNTPQSERLIFDRIRLDPDASNWIVLHSVGLTKTNRGPYGEIDFVILIPGKGIVCLEVKGGLIKCENGIWTTFNRQTNETNRLKISPYRQAQEGMFALRKAIEKEFGGSEPASSCPSSYAVVFPSVPAPPQSPGEEWWETIDSEKLRQPISKAIIRNIDGARKKLNKQPQAESCSNKAIAVIRQYLRPNFDRVITRPSTIRQSEDKLITLTEAQYDYLDIAKANDRAWIEGAAGTGKTVLAIEHARREAADNRSVLLLCYNRVLADWLQKQFSDEEKKRITIGSYHSILRKIIADSSYMQEFEMAAKAASLDELFAELLPFYGELALNEVGAIAETLIIDEAQDLIHDNNMPVLNLLVTGGLAGGSWAIFGDFTQQAIYKDSSKVTGKDTVKDILEGYCAGYSTIPLKVNCRNTKQIGEETALLSGFDSLPYRLEVDGLAVDYRYWKSKDDEQAQLKKCLALLIDDGVAPQDIVILAPNKFEKSAAETMGSINGVPVNDLRDISGEPGKCIVFSTIHSFKGMESSVVVLCGIKDLNSDEDKSLLYVGMSRARNHLILIANERIKAALPELTRKRLSGDW